MPPPSYANLPRVYIIEQMPWQHHGGSGTSSQTDGTGSRTDTPKTQSSSLVNVKTEGNILLELGANAHIPVAVAPKYALFVSVTFYCISYIIGLSSWISSCHVAPTENARLEISGPYCRGGKCRTGKCGTGIYMELLLIVPRNVQRQDWFFLLHYTKTSINQ